MLHQEEGYVAHLNKITEIQKKPGNIRGISMLDRQVLEARHLRIQNRKFITNGKKKVTF